MPRSCSWRTRPLTWSSFRSRPRPHHPLHHTSLLVWDAANATCLPIILPVSSPPMSAESDPSHYPHPHMCLIHRQRFHQRQTPPSRVSVNVARSGHPLRVPFFPSYTRPGRQSAFPSTRRRLLFRAHHICPEICSRICSKPTYLSMVFWPSFSPHPLDPKSPSTSSLSFCLYCLT